MDEMRKWFKKKDVCKCDGPWRERESINTGHLYSIKENKPPFKNAIWT